MTNEELNSSAYPGSGILRDLIHEHESRKRKQATDFQKYRGKELPIQSRYFTDNTKLNSRIVNDFRGEIVDQIVGFVFGKPITYSLDRGYFGSELEYTANSNYLRDFMTMNNVQTLDVLTAVYMVSAGSAYRLLYIDKRGNERMKVLNPWECIVIYDRSRNEPQYAIRYYTVKDNVDGRVIPRTRVEWYTDKTITYYITDNSGNYILDNTEHTNPVEHNFDMVPLVEFVNGVDGENDFYRVESLIDAYDRTLSDAQNEIEEFRQAYLVFEGTKVDEETLLRFRQTGAIELPAGASASYLTKEINGTFLSGHRDTLKSNIYRFSKTIDMASDTFIGMGASGEARKWMLTPLEFRAAILVSQFQRSLHMIFDIMEPIWRLRGKQLSARNINLTFDRTYPAEMSTEAKVVSMLKGVVSDETIYENVSFINNPYVEKQRMERQRKETGTGNDE